MTTWVNGRPGSWVRAADRGLAYGDGVFETMRVRAGAVRLLDHHLDRLADSCARLGIALTPRTRLRAELTRAAARRRDAVLKLIVTRGVGRRGYRPSGAERCTRVLALHPAPPPAPRAARVRLCVTRLGVNEALAGMKTLNRLESVLARAEWRDAGIWEGLMRDADDHIVCGTMSNVFVRRGAVLTTPPLDRCGVAGVMRRWVLAQAAGVGLKAGEARLRWHDLAEAEEVFLTNAIVGVVPVARIGQGRQRLDVAQRTTAEALRDRLERA